MLLKVMTFSIGLTFMKQISIALFKCICSQLRVNIIVWKCSILKRSFILYNLTDWGHLWKSLYARVTWLPLKQQTCRFREASHADVMAACTSASWNHLNGKKMRQRLDVHHAWVTSRSMQRGEARSKSDGWNQPGRLKSDSAWVQMSKKGACVRVCVFSFDEQVSFLFL